MEEAQLAENQIGQIILYRSYWEAIQLMTSTKDKMQLMEAIMEYGLDGTEPSGLSGNAAAMFAVIKPTLRKSRNKALNGKQGGSK